jgi:hypothetical protein
MKVIHYPGGGKVIEYYEDGDYIPVPNTDKMCLAVPQGARKAGNFTVTAIRPVGPKA